MRAEGTGRLLDGFGDEGAVGLGGKPAGVVAGCLAASLFEEGDRMDRLCGSSVGVGGLSSC